MVVWGVGVFKGELLLLKVRRKTRPQYRVEKKTNFICVVCVNLLFNVLFVSLLSCLSFVSFVLSVSCVSVVSCVGMHVSSESVPRDRVGGAAAGVILPHPFFAIFLCPLF